MEDHHTTVAVVGLGFIGLPLALSYAMEGINVVGVDVNEELVRRIGDGESDLEESFEGRTIEDILKRELESGRFRPTTEYAEAAAAANDYVITVGLPVNGGKVDFSPLDSCIRSLGNILKPDDLVLLRSTLVPGTTLERVAPLLEEISGMRAGRDFYLAYSSERIAEGRAFEEFRHMPLAVGGIDIESAERARRVLSLVTEAKITVSDIATVETAKILENLQRDINIAVSQEFASFADALDIDTYELIRVANTHRRVNLLTPGPGVGGYCLPYALHYLMPRAEEFGVDLPLARLARSINRDTPVRMVRRLASLLETVGKEIEGSHVAVIGLAMKDYSGDDRESPALQIVKALAEAGATVTAHDPVIPDGRPFTCTDLAEALRGADALIVAARQRSFDRADWPELLQLMAADPVIVDTRHLLDDLRLRSDAVVWRI
ncbi:MAG: nucleotide sugar dehydrogenase [Clostridia bacterium]